MIFFYDCISRYSFLIVVVPYWGDNSEAIIPTFTITQVYTINSLEFMEKLFFWLSFWEKIFLFID